MALSHGYVTIYRTPRPPHCPADAENISDDVETFPLQEEVKRFGEKKRSFLGILISQKFAFRSIGGVRKKNVEDEEEDDDQLGSESPSDPEMAMLHDYISVFAETPWHVND
ncbi:hypothetical protein V1477_008186 [Vespula maculifrons]|uniref:Uncharacterized protein n=2 Tax=Vespula TaxID=7451 RepID=A0A834JSG6_VESVU|nr:hypothetical protein HZH66_009201 [Vespula vulgaris]